MVRRYEVLQEIGRGGMGIVYKARQPDLDRVVALKRLHSVYADTPEFVQRFLRESRLAGSLNHPNIVTVHDYIEEDGASYIAMEYMPRGSLRSWVDQLSLAQLAGVLEGLLAALVAVEPSGIVHRDLKPENVLVTKDGRVKITDFGIAKATQSVSGASFMTATGATVGTPAYMAPEQALSETVGPWTDLYSVGVMTYEQLVGSVPFHDSLTPMAVLLRHAHDPIPPVIDSRPEIHPSLSDWVARLLVKEPARRTHSAMQAWEELEEILLELLGPRWRRDARLPERSSLAGSPKPLTPAPFDSHQIQRTGASQTPSSLGSSVTPRAPIPPEVESKFLSYGRAPTGAQQTPPTHPENQPASAPLESSLRRPHETSHEQARAQRKTRIEPTRQRRARRLVAVTLLVALTGSVGFALAPDGKSTPAPARKSVSKGTSSHLRYTTTLSNAISKLNSTRAEAGAQLASARSEHGQASAARRLARAHEQAAATMQKAAPGSLERNANAAIATALSNIGSGYSMMASAAEHKDRQGFNRGREAVAAATASLTLAFGQLHKLGYELSS